MITRTATLSQIPDWQIQLANAIRDIDELFGLIGLAREAVPELLNAQSDFPIRIPHAYARRIQPGKADDPLLRQVLPLLQESLAVPGYSPDPVRDRNQMPVPGLLHKYHGRVLLTLTGACAIHCRYCFRRHFPYTEANPCGQDWPHTLEYIRQQTDIDEVILSGGDPLSLSDQRLAGISEELGTIPHLKRLRIHSRLPVVIPDRVTSQVTDWLASCRLQTIIVLHVNHAQELNEHTRLAFQCLRDATDSLLNQTVLLKDINDQAGTLATLSEALFDQGVMPYYLHCLDPVAGAAHFDLPESRISEIWQQLRAILPGYLLPRLVREIPGASAKIPFEIMD